MIRRREDMREIDRENLLGGEGTVKMLQLLEMEEMQEKMRVCSIASIPPGVSIGHHAHEKDSEIYFVLEGEVKVLDNGEETTMKAGDIMFTCNGESHQLWNESDKEAKMLFVVMLV